MNKMMLLKFRYIMASLATLFGRGAGLTDRAEALSHPCAENGAMFHRPSRPFKLQCNRKFKKKLRYS